MADPLPHAPATVRNREPILEVLREHFAGARRVLEIGSGTGEHAVHFAAALPHLDWQPSDLPARHAAIRGWIAVSGVDNNCFQSRPRLGLQIICKKRYKNCGSEKR